MIKAEKVHDEIYTARNFSSSPLTISNLDGDFYDYELVTSFNFSSATATEVRLRLNADSTSNYRSYRMRGYSSTANASVTDATTFVRIGAIKSTTQALSKVKITGSSGEERYVSCFFAGENSVNEVITVNSGYWKNTANPITSLVIDYGTSATSDAHIMLYRTPKASEQSNWELVKTLEWSAETNITKTVTGLDGDTDIEYKVDLNFREGASTAVSVQPNGDSLLSNYVQSYLYNDAGVLSAGITTGGNMFDTATLTIHAESGVKRIIQSTQEGIAKSYSRSVERVFYWNNTADNITTIEIKALGLSTGYAKVYRRIEPSTTGDTLPFEVIETFDISGSFSAGHTFSNLLGDSVNLYKLEYFGDVNDANTRIRVNADSGSNYTRQQLNATTTTPSAAVATSTQADICPDANTKSAQSTVYIYPKSGTNRPMLVENMSREDTLQKLAIWWNNSANEITSLFVFGSNSNSMTGKLILSRLV